MSVGNVLLIFLLLILFGGFGGNYVGYGYGYGFGHGGMGMLGILLIVLLVLIVAGRL